mgnify:CR=1 FL=1
MALAGQPADDAATLAFGPEFPLDSCECLSDAEVTTILDTHLRSSAAADRPFPRKALEYARRATWHYVRGWVGLGGAGFGLGCPRLTHHRNHHSTHAGTCIAFNNPYQNPHTHPTLI